MNMNNVICLFNDLRVELSECNIPTANLYKPYVIKFTNQTRSYGKAVVYGNFRYAIRLSNIFKKFVDGKLYSELHKNK